MTRRRVAALVLGLCAIVLMVELWCPGIVSSRMLGWWFRGRLVASLSSQEARERGLFVQSLSVVAGPDRGGCPIQIEAAWLEHTTVRVYTNAGTGKELILKGTQEQPSTRMRVGCDTLCVRLTRTNDATAVSSYTIARVRDGLSAEQPAHDQFDLRFYASKRLVFFGPVGAPPFQLKLSGPRCDLAFELR